MPNDENQEKQFKIHNLKEENWIVFICIWHDYPYAKPENIYRKNIGKLVNFTRPSGFKSYTKINRDNWFKLCVLYVSKGSRNENLKINLD